MITEPNVHFALDETTYNRIVKHLASIGAEVKTQRHNGEVLYTTVTATLFLSPSKDRPFESVAIHDKTYSKGVFRIERDTKNDDPYQI